MCSVITAALCGAALAAAAQGNRPILHEPIAPNPVEDLAMHVVTDGDLPAALLTSAGPVSAPDPRSLPSGADTHYGSATARDEFRPDRDPRAIDSAYDDPFTPSTAPFKRVAAFDAVRSDYALYVQSTALSAVPSGPAPQADDDAFYMDAVVDVSPGARVRIPSVGPSARIISGRLGIGAQSIGYSLSRDGADNWYLEALAPRGQISARLVLELAIARATFGGPMADASWSEMRPAISLPPNVAREAEQVCAAIGVSRRMRPREAVARLVDYFRGFSESNEPVNRRASVYLDLALSKTGVCRHRAFAFMITALELGIPTRLAENEAHAWVEVHDGVGWRRIDLGGAGQLTANLEQEARPAYRGPGDAFPWPLGAQRSDPSAPTLTQGTPADDAHGPRAAPAASETEPGAAPPAVGVTDWGATTSETGAPSSVSLIVLDDGVRRGGALRARGEIRANGEPCPNLGVDVLLRNRDTRRLTFLGTLATGEDGSFVGSVVVPASTPVGDYDFIAKTGGSGRCGPGQN
jgi:Transglutaminase-like superfamily